MMRTIKSFVRRNGRMTCAQQLAFESLWPEFGLDIPPLEKGGRGDLKISVYKQTSQNPPP